MFVAIGTVIITAPFYHLLIDWRIVFVSVVVAAILGGRRAMAKPTKGIVYPILIGVLVLPSMLVVAGFAKFDVYAVLHHLQFGMMDADLGIVLRSLVPLISALCLFVLGLYWLKNLLGLTDRVYWYGSVLIATINPLTINLFEIVKTPSFDDDLSRRIAAPAVILPQSRPDIVVVYLEGLDRSFADRSVFGDLYAPLERLGEDGIVFTQVKQIIGTSWSLAGLVATQCGLPLLPNGLRNFYSFQDQTAFIDDHPCLSDILADQGYHNVHVMGGAVAFGGQDHFLRTHQFQTVQDKQNISAMFDAQTVARATAARNLDDQMVFDVALRTYEKLVDDPRPIGMVVTTIGPHGDSGVLARNCTDTGQAIETGDLSATARCTISNTMSFLQGLKAARNNRPTLLVVMSDHLNHAWPNETRHPHGGRSNTVIMSGLDMPDVATNLRIDRPASMIDVYPTIVTLLGMTDATSFGGLGVSMLGDAPTLVEEKGFVRLNQELTRNFDLSRAIWGDNSLR